MVPATIRLPLAGALYTFVSESTARIAALLRAQALAAREAIRVAMREGAAA